MTTKNHIIFIIFLIILSIFFYFVRGVNQVDSTQPHVDLSCVLPLHSLKAYQDNAVVQRNYDNLSNLSGSDMWLEYGRHSHYVDENGLASEGFDWPTDHKLTLTIQGRQANNQIGQITIYTSESVPNRYWILGYNSLRIGTDTNGNHNGIHPCITFETENIYGLIKQ